MHTSKTNVEQFNQFTADALKNGPERLNTLTNTLQSNYDNTKQSFEEKGVFTMIRETEPVLLNSIKQTTVNFKTTVQEFNTVTETEAKQMKYTLSLLNEMQTEIELRNTVQSGEFSRTISADKPFTPNYQSARSLAQSNILQGNQNPLDRNPKENPQYSIYSFNPSEATSILNTLTVNQLSL
ncbi:hypothetical protein BLNAU_16906 [Blattamonas nauphoetae]|uniref:Uncharacterized protein n=1 Tax=Blattamonas nauphoetae TaxID=2049346 RepID=A0ABQ9XAC1_9EUKA|nr:hypothetical protein BLNAU_16906 [Blattamonas nauphoetae]